MSHHDPQSDRGQLPVRTEPVPAAPDGDQVREAAPPYPRPWLIPTDPPTV